MNHSCQHTLLRAITLRFIYIENNAKQTNAQNRRKLFQDTKNFSIQAHALHYLRLGELDIVILDRCFPSTGTKTMLTWVVCIVQDQEYLKTITIVYSAISGTMKKFYILKCKDFVHLHTNVCPHAKGFFSINKEKIIYSK